MCREQICILWLTPICLFEFDFVQNDLSHNVHVIRFKLMMNCIYMFHQVLFGSKQFLTQSSCFVITLWMVARCPIKVAFMANDFSHNVQVKGFSFNTQNNISGKIVFICKPFVTQCAMKPNRALFYICTWCHKLLGCNGDLNRHIDVEYVFFRFCTFYEGTSALNEIL